MALVYVTDDEPNICKLVAFGLKDEGFETATFTDGNSLLEAIQKRKTGRYHFRLDDAAPGWL